MVDVYWRLCIFFAALPLFLLNSSCDIAGNPALGPYAEVHVIAQQEPDDEMMLPFREAMEVSFRTFQEETLFVLLPRPVRRFEDVQNRKNLIFPVDLSDRGYVTRIAGEMLGNERIREARQSGEPALYFLDNPWATGQTAAFVLGATREIVLRGVREEGDRIRAGFLGANRRRIMNFLTFRGENFTLSRKIHANFGWTIRMPAPFTEDEQYLDQNYFTMKMDKPGRILFVYWEEGVVELPDEDEIVSLRQRLGWDFGDEDEVEESSLHIYRSTFQERKSIRLEGIWQNDKYTIGGPFRSIVFVQEEEKRLFLIDYAVYAPGFPKKYYLWELESVLETFSFEAPDPEGQAS